MDYVQSVLKIFLLLYFKQEQKTNNKPTIPSTIDEEKKINPFMRVGFVYFFYAMSRKKYGSKLFTMYILGTIINIY